MEFGRLQVSDKAMKKSEKRCGEILEYLLEVFNVLLPQPSISSPTNIGQLLQQPRRVTHKSVHILLLVLAMILCVVISLLKSGFVPIMKEEAVP